MSRLSPTVALIGVFMVGACTTTSPTRPASGTTPAPATTRPITAATATPGFYTLGLAVAIRPDGTGAVLGSTCDSDLRCSTWTRTTNDNGATFPATTQHLILRDPNPNQVFGGLSAGPGQSLYVFSLRGDQGAPMRWSVDDGRTWRVSALHPFEVLVVGSSVWLSTQSCIPTSCRARILAGQAGGNPDAFTPLPTPPGRSIGFQLTRQSELTAYAVAGEPVVNNLTPPQTFWATTDAGRTWVQRAQPCPQRGDGGAQASAATDGTVWMSCRYGNGGAGSLPKKVFRSTNAGETWTPVGDPGISGYANEITAVNSSVAYLAGGRSPLLRTIDAGRSWREVTPYEDSFGPVVLGAHELLMSVVRVDVSANPTQARPLVGSVWRRVNNHPWSYRLLEQRTD